MCVIEFLYPLPCGAYKLSTGMALRAACYFFGLLSFFRNLSLFSRETSRLVYCFAFWPLSTPLMLILGS